MKIAILGAGAMGTACSLMLAAREDLEVVLWTHLKEHADEIRHEHENRRFFPGVPLPQRIHITSDGELAVSGATLIVLAIPTVYLRQALQPLATWMPAHVPVASVAKGLEQQTFARPSQIIAEILHQRPLAALCGPSHAEELAKGLPASVVAASDDAELAHLVQQVFSSETFRVYTNDDLIGVELCGALKNIIAIAAGACDGLGFGDNTKSALMARGLVEMVRFTTALGGRAETCYGLAGIGDLITTCISPYGRNRAVGEKLGKGMKLDDILASTHAVAEGIWASRAVRDRSLQLGVEMPITHEVCEVLFAHKPAREAVRDLMLREPKSESC